MIRVLLPTHLQRLAGTERECLVPVAAPYTIRQLLDALEGQWPALKGTVLDHATAERRPYLRFFACHEDLSHENLDTCLPTDVISQREPFIILGAIAGG